MSTAFDRAWDATGRAEGGYVNNPNDSGGETNHGITIKVARQHGYHGPMQDLPASFAREIAKKAYWDPLNLDLVAAASERVAMEVFDTNFNTRWGFAAEALQRALNVFNRGGRDYPDIVQDGKLGPKTVDALRTFLAVRRHQNGEVILLRALNSLQGTYYITVAENRPKDEDFTFGWFAHRVVI